MSRDSRTLGRISSGSGSEDSALLTTSSLRKLRQARGLGATELARRVGVSRQTIYAIESGDYIPNTAVALQLARVLDLRVEDLFSISNPSQEQQSDLRAELLTTTKGECSTGELVSLSRVGSRTIAAPMRYFPAFLGDADGLILTRGDRRATIRTVTEKAAKASTLVIAGCDPALSLLVADLKRRGTEVISVPCSSQEALNWLKNGLVHVAGAHLRDQTSGEYNIPTVTALFGNGKVRVTTFAEWEQGLVVRRGNPKRIGSIADLGNKRITIVNREKGAGARDLLDSGLRSEGIPWKNVLGYNRIVPSHLAAALAVVNSQADCCVATISAARSLGLDFVPLSKERFDLVIASSQADTSSVRVLFEVLSHAALRQKLVTLAGYNVRHTGRMLI